MDDPHRFGAPEPVRRPQDPAQDAAAKGPVENPLTASRRPPERVVPEGFSRSFDAEYQAVHGQPSARQQPAMAMAGGGYGAPGQPGSQGSWVPMQPAPAPARRGPAALPLEGQVYAQVLRPLPRRVGRWFLAWGIAIGFFAFGQTIAVVLLLPTILDLFADPLAAASMDPVDLMGELMGSPMAFLGVNLSWAAMIPGAVVAMAAYGDKAMGFMFSVAGRWRWRVVGRAALVIAPVFALYVGLTLVLEPGVEWRFQPDWLLVAIVLLTTPLQSSGEEFAFRGIVTQQLGGWLRNPWVASFLTGGLIGLVFGLAHIGYPPLAILQVSLVGFTASMLTFRTGGLEAACVLHTANNFFIMMPLALIGQSPFATSEGESPFWIQLVAFVACLAALGISYLLVHVTMRTVQRRTEGAPGADLLLLPKQQPMVMVAAPGVAYGHPGPQQQWGGQPVGAQQQWAPQQAAPQQWAPQQAMAAQPQWGGQQAATQQQWAAQHAPAGQQQWAPQEAPAGQQQRAPQEAPAQQAPGQDAPPPEAASEASASQSERPSDDPWSRPGQ